MKLGIGNNCRMNNNTFWLFLASNLQISLQGPHVVKRLGIRRITFRYSPCTLSIHDEKETRIFFNTLQHGNTLPYLFLQSAASAVSKANKITKNTFTVYVYPHPRVRIFSARCPLFVLIPVISNLIT